MPEKWSQHVTDTSNALDLPEGIFTWEDPQKIAERLKRAAEQSTRRKGTPKQSAVSMLNFYINRAGRKLPRHRKQILEDAKEELEALFEPDT